MICQYQILLPQRKLVGVTFGTGTSSVSFTIEVVLRNKGSALAPNFIGSSPIFELPKTSPLIEYILNSAQLSVSVYPLAGLMETDMTGLECRPKIRIN